MDEERFINIETKILHQEQILEDLHHVIYKQQETIDLLLKKIKILEDQSKSENQIGPAGEKPPHY